MKISNSKKELARIISENGGWRDGAEFSVQNGEHGRISFSTNKPVRHDQKSWMAKGGFQFKIEVCKPLPNWHQTILSRAEYLHLYPAPNSDGWIEWEGGAAKPVEFGVLVDVKLANGEVLNRVSANSGVEWRHCWGDTNIIAYRLHKPEQAKPEFCEPVARPIPEPSDKPTIEQLAADYRSAKDYAERKQQEADDAKADAEVKLKALELAGEAIGLTVSPITEKQEPELVIADWRDLQVGDVIRCIGDWQGEETHGVELSVDDVESPSYGGDLPIRVTLGNGGGAWGKDFKFIRRT